MTLSLLRIGFALGILPGVVPSVRGESRTGNDVQRGVEIPLAAGLAFAVEIGTGDDFQHGLERYRSGDLDGAIAAWTAGLKKNPQDAGAAYHRGTAKREKGDLIGAIADYNRAVELNPKYAEAFYHRGVAKRDKGDLDGAIADYSRALELNPKDAEAFHHRGMARRDKGDVEGAIVDYDHSLELNPGSSEAYVNRGNAMRDKGDHWGAIADYNRALELNPKSAAACMNRGFARGALGDQEGAIADYNQALQFDPKSGSTNFDHGDEKTANDDGVEDVEDAVDSGSEPAESDPKSPKDYVNQGLASIADYNRAIELDPKCTDAYYNRGLAKSTKGDHDQAIADFNRTIELNPKSAEAYIGRGLTKSAKGDLDGAGADFDRARELDAKSAPASNEHGALPVAQIVHLEPVAASPSTHEPNLKSAKAYVERGVGFYQQQDWQRACADFEAAARQKLPSKYARLYLCIVKQRLGQGEEGLNNLRAHLGPRSDARPGDWVSTLGGFLLGELDEATLLKAAAKSEKTNHRGQRCEAWYFAGMQRLAAGQKEEAAKCFHNSLATDAATFNEYKMAAAELQALGNQ